MKNIWIKICAVCLILIVGVLTWEITTLFIWKSQMAELVKEEHANLEREFDFNYSIILQIYEDAVKQNDQGQARRFLDRANRLLISKPGWKELQQQSEQNVRKRGNPYSLFL